MNEEMLIENKILYAVATYNRADVVLDFFKEYQHVLKNDYIDVVFFDSSENSYTEEIVEKYQNDYRIRHFRVPSEMGLSEKVFRILQGVFFDGIENYKYVWMANDSIHYSADMISRVEGGLKAADYDIAVVDWIPNEGNDVTTYTEINSFFDDCAYKTTLLGSVIMNVQTMLKGIDWNKYNDFLGERYVDWAINNLYFHRIPELKNFRAVYFPLLKNGLKYSRKKKTTHWQKRYYDVICRGWVDTVEGLPDCYENKNALCMKITHLRQGLLEMILVHRRRGYYSYKVYKRNEERWRKVTTIPQHVLLGIALYPRFILQIKYSHQRRKLSNEIRRFRKKHKNLVVYGTGDNGYWMKEYLEKNNIRIDAFCVSYKGGMEKYEGYPLYDYSEVNDIFPDVGYVVAMKEENVIDVIPNIRKRNADENIYYEPFLYKDVLMEEIGYRF